MNELLLTFASSEYYDRTRALIDGTVKAHGIDLRYVPMTPDQLFRRIAQYAEFDVSEMSVSTYMNLISRGDTRYIAIPIYLSRNFRHSYVFLPGDSPITKPEELRGKTVGVAEYQMTAAVWQRAFMEHDYGISPRDMTWVEGGLWGPGFIERNPIPPPPGVSIGRIPEDKTLHQMLAAGELDALFTAARPPQLTDGSGRIRRLFPNYVQLEQDYYRRTGIFPIMHTVVVRRSIYEANRWIAASLALGFAQAQEVGWKRSQETGTLTVMLPWMQAQMEEILEVMGPRHWKYGFAENHTTLEAMCKYHYEQALSERRLQPEELFAEETLEMRLSW